jgi:hypothetical protein
LPRSPLLELALVLVRLDHSASVIVNANHGVMWTAAKFRVAGFKPLFEKINVRLIAYSGLLHGLVEIVRSRECFCLIDIFHREKQQHFIWILGVAEKVLLL